MEKKVLEYTLVPVGMMMMVTYHVWLVKRIVSRPTTTVIGINSINRRLWVRAMMEDVGKNGVLAVQTLRNNIMASTLLASTAIMLSSLIAVLMTSGSSGGRFVFASGDMSDLAFSIKFFSILVCFLVAFLLNVQSIRYYSHASVLINVPFNKTQSQNAKPNVATTTISSRWIMWRPWSTAEAISGRWGCGRSTFHSHSSCGSLDPSLCFCAVLFLFVRCVSWMLLLSSDAILEEE